MFSQPGDLASLFRGLLHATALTEVAVLIGCLALAWLVVWLLRGKERKRDSIWFGERLVDGVLFPIVALVTAEAARHGLAALGVPLAVFKLAMPILVSLVVIRLGVRVLRVAFPNSKLIRVVERTLSWLVWAWLVLWLTGLLPAVMGELEDVSWKVGTTEVTLRAVLEGLFTAGWVLVLVLWVSAAIESRLLKGAGSGNLSLRKIAANTVRALLLFIGLLFALEAAGIDLTALGVLGGAVGVGLGFGLQKLASNYVSGFVILAERSLRIGDMVKVDNFEGRITDITTRYTVIRAVNGRESIVPNEMLITQRIENSSLADTRVSTKTVVQVAYGTDLDTLIPRLTDAVAEVPRVLNDPAPKVLLTQFASDGLELTVVFWIDDPEKGDVGARAAVNLQLWRTLNALDIEIPFAQRVVTLANPPAAWSEAPGGAAVAQMPNGVDAASGPTSQAPPQPAGTP